MKYFILVLILFLTGLAGFAQQVMLADSITKNPVSYATVYDADGSVIGRSDMRGYIQLQKGLEYHISHISYKPMSLIHDDDSIIFLSPSSYEMSEVNVTARKKKYYHCKVYFRSIEHVDSCLKYYMDGIREFYVDTKSKKVYCGNTETNYLMSKRKDIAQKKRSMMIGDKYMALPFFNKNEMLLSIDALFPRSTLVTNLFGYTQVLSKHNKTELYRYSDFDAPSIFNLKSSNSYRHLTLTHKKEHLVREIDVEDVFYVVESEYTDTKALSSSKLLREDYNKYSGMFPVIERIREQLVQEDFYQD